jgi:glutamyl-tRNA reductase
MIDLAMPRDIDPAVQQLDGVYLYDLDSLQSIAERTLAVRQQVSAKCYQLIEHHVQDFKLWIERSQSSNFCSIVDRRFLASTLDAMLPVTGQHALPFAILKKSSAPRHVHQSVAMRELCECDNMATDDLLENWIDS